MKPAGKIILTVILGICLNNGYAQHVVQEITHYLFPEFTMGTVVMTTGVRNDTPLNYNSLTEEMLFFRDGKRLAISNLNEIDSVLIENRVFIPLEKKFMEVVYHNSFDLYALHKADVVDPGKPAAYGGTSHTAAITPITSISMNGQTYSLKAPASTETRAFIQYWLK